MKIKKVAFYDFALLLCCVAIFVVWVISHGFTIGVLMVITLTIIQAKVALKHFNLGERSRN